jgi:hypothetical protein
VCFEFTGTVHRLTSTNARKGGCATVLAEIDGAVRSVQIDLDAANYATAIAAHEGRDLVRCEGELQRSAGKFVLKNPRSFGRLVEES